MFCLDTNVIIFALNGRRPAIDRRLQAELTAGTALLVPTPVLFELFYGIAKSERRETSERLLRVFLAEGFTPIAFDEADAAEAGDMRAFLERQGTPIGACDLLIAAQARRRGAALVTLNHREFERIPGLVVTQWSA